MVNLVKNTPHIPVVLASLLLWVSFAWGLPAEAADDETPQPGLAGYRLCPQCATVNVPEAKFCTRCGASLVGHPAPKVPPRRTRVSLGPEGGGGVVVTSESGGLGASLGATFVVDTKPVGEEVTASAFLAYLIDSGGFDGAYILSETQIYFPGGATRAYIPVHFSTLIGGGEYFYGTAVDFIIGSGVGIRYDYGRHGSHLGASVAAGYSSVGREGWEDGVNMPVAAIGKFRLIHFYNDRVGITTSAQGGLNFIVLGGTVGVIFAF
jgi:hypothetical protein